MGRGARPAKAKTEATSTVTRKSRKLAGSTGVQLKHRLAAALQQHAAISEILQTISASPGDVQPVLDAVAERAALLCQAPLARVLLVDGHVLRSMAEYTLDGTIQARTAPLPLKRTTITGRAVLDRATIHHDDVVPLLDSEYPDALNARRLGLRAVLAVPLIREGNAYGVVLLFRREPQAFSSDQVALVETFAQQAAIAVDNVRLFKATREALEQQTATSEILRVINRSPAEVQPVLDAVAERAGVLCHADGSRVWLLGGGQLRAMTSYGSAYASNSKAEALPLRPTSIGGRAALERRVVHVEDVLPLIETEYPDVRELQKRYGFRTVLNVPLLREGEAIGVISLLRNRVRSFTPGEINLVQTFADQAAIAIENARLFKETREALERQTATSEILRVISQSPTDVQPVLDAIAVAALKPCGASSAIVTTFDGELIHAAATANINPEAVDSVRATFPRPPGRGNCTARAVQTCSIDMIPDVLEDAEYEVQAVAVAGGFRSVLSVPLVRQGKPIGTITVGRPEPGPFPDNQIALLKTFADQAVIAIENVRLFTELEARTSQLTRSVGELRALGEVGQAVSSTLELETVLRTIVSRAGQLAGMDGGAIFEYDEAHEEFSLRATDNLPAELVSALGAAPIPRGEGAVGRLAVTGEPVQIRDIVEESGYQSRVRDFLLRMGSRALLAVPLLRENRILGGLVVNRNSAGEFAPEVIDLLKSFATQSALAIQNARLYREIEIKSRQLETASQHKSEFLANMSHELRTPLNAIIGFSEVLSERMFGEVNDKQAEYLSDILESGRHLLSLINDVLDLSKIEAGRMELEPTDFDLPRAIENTLMLVRERAQRRAVTLAHTIDEDLGVIRGDERKVKQVLLNLLSNALKFTPEGGRIDVRAAVRDGAAEISVTDTGVGIAPEDQGTVFEEFRQVGTAAKEVEGTGLGLAISRKFIELHGGRIWVKSQVGTGSTFTFTLPLQ